MLHLLRTHLESKAPELATMLDSSLSIITSTTNPLRFSFAALGLRETLREYFAVVSPDNSVSTAKWHEVKDPKNPVTRGDRILFSIYSYISPSFFSKSFSDEVDILVDDLVKKIKKLSKYIHFKQDIFSISEKELENKIEETLNLFYSLVTAIETAHSHVLDELATQLSDTLSDMFRNDFFDELDCLSTHTRPQSADDVEVTIISIDCEKIHFSGSGSVSCDLQYGSDGDCACGDGLESSGSYPFSFSGTSPVERPTDVDVSKDDINIDTDSFYE